MFRPLPVYLGWRNVFAKTDNTFIAFISWVSIIGLVLGVAVLITVLSVMNGFERELKSKILGVIPQVTVKSSERMPDWQHLAQHIQAADHNIQAIAPFSHAQAMVSTPQGQMKSVLVTGIVPQYEKPVSIIDDLMIAGDFDALSQPKQHMVIGKTLAEQLKVKVGDRITVILPEGTRSSVGVVPHYFEFQIAGIFKLRPDAEQVMAYVPMATLNDVLSQPAGAQGLRFKLHDVFAAPQTATRASQAQAGLTAQNWTMTNGSMFRIIRMQKAMMALILAFIVVVAGFNLVSSLMMVVTDKKVEIAILKTFGATPRMVRQVFVVQGGLIALIGVSVGGALGVLTALNIGWLSGWLDTTFDLNLFANYYVTQLPAELHWLEVVGIMLVSALLAVLATLYPAHKAANILPAQALRSDA